LSPMLEHLGETSRDTFIPASLEIISVAFHLTMPSKTRLD